jgi:hypothetical protein
MHVRTIADHARIVDALKVNRCPDCSNLGFEPGARRPGTNKLSKDYYCLSAGLVSTSPPQLSRRNSLSGSAVRRCWFIGLRL